MVTPTVSLLISSNALSPLPSPPFYLFLLRLPNYSSLPLMRKIMNSGYVTVTPDTRKPRYRSHRLSPVISVRK